MMMVVVVDSIVVRIVNTESIRYEDRLGTVLVVRVTVYYLVPY